VLWLSVSSSSSSKSPTVSLISLLRADWRSFEGSKDAVLFKNEAKKYDQFFSFNKKKIQQSEFQKMIKKIMF